MKFGIALVCCVLAFALPAAAQDGDADGMPDAWEAAHSCLYPAIADDDLDPDGDALANGLEYGHSLDPCAADTDGDEVKDGFEVNHGSDPHSGAIRPRLVSTTTIAPDADCEKIIAGPRGFICLGADPILTRACRAEPDSCPFDLTFRLYNRHGRPIADEKIILRRLVSHDFQAAAFAGSLWITATDGTGPVFIRLDSWGERVVEDRREWFPLAGGVWNPNLNEFFANFSESPFDHLHLSRFHPDMTLAGETVAALSVGSAFARPAWTGSEYGLPLAAASLSFARLGPNGRLIAQTSLSTMDPRWVDPVWTYSEFFLVFSEGTSTANGTACDSTTENCRDVTVLMRVNPDGTLAAAPRMIPTPGSKKSDAGAPLAAVNIYRGYLGVLTPDLTTDPDGYCSPAGCNLASWLHWMERDGTDIAPPVSLGRYRALSNPTDPYFRYFLEPWAGSTAEPRFISFQPDSDGDGITDPYDNCQSASDWDHDNDGFVDGDQDHDGDGVIDRDDPDPCGPDADGDGLTDLEEITGGSDPNAQDGDRDGMPDAWEISAGTRCGLDPLYDDARRDPDGDGIRNLNEYLRDKNPCGDKDSGGGGGCTLAASSIDGAGPGAGWAVPALLLLALRARRKIRR